LCDLALVTVDDDSFWEGMPAISFSDSVPRLGDSIVAVGYPLDARTVTITSGIVSSVEMSDLSLALYEPNPQLLKCIIDAPLNGGNSGGPVFDEETAQVVGVVYAGADNAQGRNFIISMPVVRMFLEGYKKDGRSNYGLLSETGFHLEHLINPAQRKKYLQGGSVKNGYGCLINEVEKFSSADGLIKVGDILLAIDGNPVSECNFGGLSNSHMIIL
jgi:S1-C subfamily serine protease